MEQKKYKVQDVSNSMIEKRSEEDHMTFREELKVYLEEEEKRRAEADTKAIAEA